MNPDQLGDMQMTPTYLNDGAAVSKVGCVGVWVCPESVRYSADIDACIDCYIVGSNVHTV